MADPIGDALAGIQDNFDALSRLAGLERVRGLARAGQDIAQRFEAAVREASPLEIDQLEEVRQLREGMIPPEV